MNTYSKPTVLSIAGSDCSGGAGIQADLLTFSALDVHGCSVITAVTAQNSRVVDAIHVTPPNIVSSQINSITADFPIAAIKIGMLSNQAMIDAIVEKLTVIDKLVVLDPILAATTGVKLLANNAIEILKKRLFPLATLVTPNIPEAETLIKQKINNLADMKTAAKILLDYGCKNVLIKSGHLANANTITDLFMNQSKSLVLTHPKINKQMRGTGCILSSAITAYLAKNNDLITSIQKATDFVANAIENSVVLGKNKHNRYLNF